MLPRIKLNWELFKVIDSDVKEKIKHSLMTSCSGIEPQIQITEGVKLIKKSPLNMTRNRSSGNHCEFSKGKTSAI